MERSFSGCEIAEMGVQIEKNGKGIFAGLSLKAKDPSAREVFRCLSEEDARHVEVFKGIFDSKCLYKPKGAYTEEYFTYMNYIVKEYVSIDESRAMEIADKAGSDPEAVDLGVKYVKDAILFYEGVKALLSGKDLSIVEELLAQEKDHLTRLCSLKAKVTGKQGDCGKI